MSRWQLGIQALLAIMLVTACGSSTSPPPAASNAVADVPSATASSQPSSSTTPSAAPTPSATPSATPTPSPTPEPWQAYASKLNKYSIRYPPAWSVDPGDKDNFDAFDSFGEARFYVGHSVETYTVDVGDYIRQDISYYKSKFKAKVVSNKPIKLSHAYGGRIVEFLGTEDGRKVSISHVLVTKGRSWYEINFWLDYPSTSPGRELFPTIYGSWRPT